MFGGWCRVGIVNCFSAIDTRVSTVIATAEIKGCNAGAGPESVFECLSGYGAGWVKVCSNRAVEERSFLRNYGQCLPKSLSRDSRDVNAVIENLPRDNVGEAEEGEDELEDKMKQVSLAVLSRGYEQKMVIDVDRVLTVLFPEPVRPTTATR